MTTEKTIAPRQETAPALPMDNLGLSGKYDESDLVIPAWFLKQPTSTEFDHGTSGQFVTADGRVADSLIIVPLRIAATRALWPKGMAEGRRPLCASNDRVSGQPFGDYEPYGAAGGYYCERCPHYTDEPWTVENGFGCFKGYALLLAVQGIDGEEVEDEPAVIRIKGTSMAPIKAKMLSHFLRRSGKPRPVWSKVFELTSEKGESAKGNYFVIVPTLLATLEENRITHYGNLARKLAGVAVEAVEAEPEEESPIEEKGG